MNSFYCLEVELKFLFKVESELPELWQCLSLESFSSHSVAYAEHFGMKINQRANSITNISILDSLGGMKECCSSRWNLQGRIERWDKSNLLNWVNLSIQVSILQREVLCRSKSLNYSVPAVTLLSLSVAFISLFHSSKTPFLIASHASFGNCELKVLSSEPFLIFLYPVCSIFDEILTSEFAWPMLLDSNIIAFNSCESTYVDFYFALITCTLRRSAT